jgi:hypothetical protein
MLKVDRFRRSAFLPFKIDRGPSNFCAVEPPPSGEYVAPQAAIHWNFWGLQFVFSARFSIAFSASLIRGQTPKSGFLSAEKGICESTGISLLHGKNHR